MLVVHNETRMDFTKNFFALLWFIYRNRHSDKVSELAPDTETMEGTTIPLRVKYLRRTYYHISCFYKMDAKETDLYPKMVSK